jgi:hypothetical protein
VAPLALPKRRFARIRDYLSKSEMGHNAKYSSRVDIFRFASELGHCFRRSALRVCASNGLMYRSKQRRHGDGRRRLLSG